MTTCVYEFNFENCNCCQTRKLRLLSDYLVVNLLYNRARLSDRLEHKMMPFWLWYLSMTVEFKGRLY